MNFSVSAKGMLWKRKSEFSQKERTQIFQLHLGGQMPVNERKKKTKKMSDHHPKVLLMKVV